MEYSFANEKFEKRFVVVGRENGCKKCKDLRFFLDFGLDGKFNDDICKVYEETEPEKYSKLIEATSVMELPLVIDAENGNFVTGFNPAELMSILQAG